MLRRSLGLLRLNSVAGYALTSFVLVLFHPWILLEFPFGMVLILVHVAFGIAFLLAGLFDRLNDVRFGGRAIHVAAISYGLGFLLFALRGDQQAPFYIAWLVMSLSFPLLVLRTDWPNVLRRISPRRDPRYYVLIFIALALLLRLPFYLKTVRLSTDFQAYTFYLHAIEAGAAPYADVFLPYPPGFAILLQVLAALGLSPAFRGLLALPDLAIIVILAFVGDPGGRLLRTAAWALFPLAIADIAWSAHLDGIVALLILITTVALAKAHVPSALALGFATAVRPVALAAVPSALLRLGLRRKAAVFLITLAVAVGAATLAYAGQFLQLFASSVGYQITRGATNSLSFFISWFGSQGGFGGGSATLQLSTALVAASLLVVLNLGLLIRGGERGGLLRAYGLGASGAFAFWGVLILLFPLTFENHVAVAPAFPYYRPTIFYTAFGVLTAVVGIVMGREWWRIRPNDGREHADLLLALNLFATVLALQVFFSWYLLWVSPILVLLLPRRIAAVTLVAVMVIAPTAYYSADFNGLGSERHELEIEPTAFGVSEVLSPPGDPLPNAHYVPDGDRGRLTLSGRGSTNITGPVSIDPKKYGLLSLTVWSDRDPIGWNREGLSVWIRGLDAEDRLSPDYVAVQNETNLLKEGRSFAVNLAYTDFGRVTAIVIRFENFDTAPHEIRLGQIVAFDEYK